MANASLPGFGQAATSVSQGGGTAVGQGGQPPETALSGAITVSIGDAPQLSPAPQPLNVEGDFTQANNITNFAIDRANEAGNFIKALGDLASSLAPQDINPVFPNVGKLPAITTPVAPFVQTPNYLAPSVPAAFADVLTVSAAFPTFDLQPPELTFPNAPQQPVLTQPSAPAVDLNFTYPTVDVTLPDAPPLLSLNVQPFKGVDFPTLTASAPVLTAIEPTLTTYIPAAPYTDGLLTTLKDVLAQRLATGNTGRNTGLPPIVEEGIWNRGRERELRSQAAAIADLDRMEGMGYALPPGAYVDARIKIQTETNYVLAGQSRDVAAEQAKLEQANIKDALEQAAAIEGRLIEYTNTREQRQFEAMKYMTEAGISLYNAKVSAYTASVTAYRASIEVFTAQIEGAKAQVQIYTAEIEAEKLKVDANAVLVNSYKVRVDAALASIQVFQGEISLVKTRAEVEQLKVSVFGEQVRAYAAEAQVFATEVEAYKAGVEATNAKQAAYATAASAYGTLVTATAKQIDSQVETFSAKLKAAELRVETYKAEVQSAAERVRAIAAGDQATAAVYTATIQGTSSYNATLVEEYKTAETIAEQVTQIGVAAAEAQGKLYLAAAQIATDAAKVGAQVEAQLGASALGAVTFSSHRSRSDSLGYSQSVSYGESKSVSQGHSTSEGVSTSLAYSNSTSVSASTSATSSYSNSTNISEAQ